LSIGGVQALAVLAVAAAIPSIDLEWQYGAAGVVAAVAGVLLLALLLNGFAQLVAARIRTMQGFHLVMNLVLFPLLFFSGAFFPLEHLPGWLKAAAYANPITYAVDIIHLAVYAENTGGYIGLPIDFAVLISLALAAFVWGIGRRTGYQP